MSATDQPHIQVMSTQNRHPEGTPMGGQFAASARPGATVVLDGPRQPGEQECIDTERMNRIALVLGRDEEWSGSSDYLEEIAEEIASSGRPHPGSYR